MMKRINNILRVDNRTDSPIEEKLYQEFKEYGLEPQTQYPVAPFFIDLAFPEIKLAIEADGYEFHSTPDQKMRDKYRQTRLEAQGWTFERFSGRAIHKDVEVLVAKIVLKYFGKKLTKEKKTRATGKVVKYLCRKDPQLALDITNVYLDGFIFRNI